MSRTQHPDGSDQIQSKVPQHVVVLDAIHHSGRNAGHFAVVPVDYQVEDLERFQERPNRARAIVNAHSPEDLVSYYNRFCTSDSLLFADMIHCRIEAVLDWHERAAEGVPGGEGVEALPAKPITPAHREHRVQWNARFDDRWQHWTLANGQKMTQVEFARFIEDNLPDISDPDGATVLEVSKHLDAKKSVDFVSAIRLSDGATQFGYAEEVQASTKKGTMEVPEAFTLAIPVFQYGDLYEVIARLRYRIKEGKLELWFDLLNPTRVRDAAFEKIMDQVKETMSAGEMLRGNPEA